MYTRTNQDCFWNWHCCGSKPTNRSTPRWRPKSLPRPLSRSSPKIVKICVSYGYVKINRETFVFLFGLLLLLLLLVVVIMDIKLEFTNCQHELTNYCSRDVSPILLKFISKSWRVAFVFLCMYRVSHFDTPWIFGASKFDLLPFVWK